MPDGDTDLYEVMQTTNDGKCVGRYKNSQSVKSISTVSSKNNNNVFGL